MAYAVIDAAAEVDDCSRWKQGPRVVKIEIAICWKPGYSEVQCSRSSFTTLLHERLSDSFVDELCRRNPKVEVVEDEGAAAPVRCLHFVFPLT